jgi:hypothetical protein
MASVEKFFLKERKINQSKLADWLSFFQIRPIPVIPTIYLLGFEASMSCLYFKLLVKLIMSPLYVSHHRLPLTFRPFIFVPFDLSPLPFRFDL